MGRQGDSRRGGERTLQELAPVQVHGFPFVGRDSGDVNFRQSEIGARFLRARSRGIGGFGACRAAVPAARADWMMSVLKDGRRPGLWRGLLWNSSESVRSVRSFAIWAAAVAPLEWACGKGRRCRISGSRRARLGFWMAWLRMAGEAGDVGVGVMGSGGEGGWECRRGICRRCR